MELRSVGSLALPKTEREKMQGLSGFAAPFNSLTVFIHRQFDLIYRF
jgi:hypothetical protein